MTTADHRRITEVTNASHALPDAFVTAARLTNVHGVDAPEARQAWADVEALGAIIHRRARLLAGKPRGG